MIKKYAILLLSLMLLFACSVEDDQLILDADYLHVADVLQYCQGSCSNALDWEGNNIHLKGFIPDIENDSVVNDYFGQSRFFLLDERNGMFLEVRVVDDRDAIFEIIFSLGKQDRLFIKGLAESIIVNEGNDCQKGVVIELEQADNIQINL